MAAVLGDSFGYFTGSVLGGRLYKLKDGRFFKKEYLIRSREFYKKHGGKAIVLARFLPFIRTFAPIVAGISRMQYRRFIFFNVFGGVFWSLGFVLLGYFLGNTIPNVDRYLIPIILVVVVLSLVPGFLEKRRG